MSKDRSIIHMKMARLDLEVVVQFSDYSEQQLPIDKQNPQSVFAIIV